MVNESDKKETKAKMPDFILMDDTQDYLHDRQSHINPSKESLKYHSLNSSFSLRMLCLVGMILSFLVAMGMLLLTLIVFVFAAILLFQHQQLNQTLRHYWNFYINASVTALGLGIATITPPTGLGLLLIYFSFKGQTSNHRFVRNILNKILGRRN